MRIFASSRPTAAATETALMADMEEEVAAGRRFYDDGLIVQAYMDPQYTRTFMILEAESIAAAKERFDTYPQVAKRLIEFEFVPLVGMPAVAQIHETTAPVAGGVRKTGARPRCEFAAHVGSVGGATVERWHAGRRHAEVAPLRSDLGNSINQSFPARMGSLRGRRRRFPERPALGVRE